MAVDMFGLPRKDEEFLEKFSSIIRENLGNAELSNEFLAEQMNMSQSTLVRKIRKLLNTSPNNYVRSMRIAAGDVEEFSRKQYLRNLLFGRFLESLLLYQMLQGEVR